MNIKFLSTSLPKIPDSIIYIILSYYGSNRNGEYIEKINSNKYIPILNTPKKIQKYSNFSYFIDLQKYILSVSIYDRRCEDYLCYCLCTKDTINNINFGMPKKSWMIYSDYNDGWVKQIED